MKLINKFVRNELASILLTLTLFTSVWADLKQVEISPYAEIYIKQIISKHQKCDEITSNSLLRTSSHISDRLYLMRLQNKEYSTTDIMKYAKILGAGGKLSCKDSILSVSDSTSGCGYDQLLGRLFFHKIPVYRALSQPRDKKKMCKDAKRILNSLLGADSTSFSIMNASIMQAATCGESTTVYMGESFNLTRKINGYIVEGDGAFADITMYEDIPTYLQIKNANIEPVPLDSVPATSSIVNKINFEAASIDYINYSGTNKRVINVELDSTDISVCYHKEDRIDAEYLVPYIKANMKCILEDGNIVGHPLFVSLDSNSDEELRKANKQIPDYIKKAKSRFDSSMPN